MRGRALLILLVAGAAAFPAAALAHGAPPAAVPAADSAGEARGAGEEAAQHGRGRGHLPPARHAVEVVGRLRVRDAGEGRVADVAAHGRYAYLGAFREPRCRRGGVYVIDIGDPARPRQMAFVRAAPGSYVGEGVQVVPQRTPAFRGDLLVYNNEICRRGPGAVGGISLVDVSDPRRPRKLVDGAGDRSFADGRQSPIAHQVHSAFAWQDDGRAYVVMVDDEEPADVDIMDITDPRGPRLVSETDLNALGVEQPRVNGQESFLHDMVVKEIGGRQVLLASYWDGGYVQVDVEDPARPALVRHTDFAVPDPERAARGQRDLTSEGNAHQAEFDRTNRFFVATDEDFEPFRITARVTSGPERGRPFEFSEGEPGGALATGVAKEEDARDDGSRIDDDTSLSGPTTFAGLACEPGSVPRAQPAAPVAVVERGVCEFTVKARNVAAAGYRGAIVFNRTGPDGGCDAPLGGILQGTVPVLFVTRSEGLRLLGAFDPDTYRCAGEEGEDPERDTPSPPVGTRGAAVDVRATFDGWGYVHLFDRRTARELDTWAIPEAQSKRYARGFGDLSVHEVATDPDDESLAYFSYYAGGFRVVRFDRRGIREVGRYVARGGSNLWGVQVHRHPNGRKYVLASDRDYGLYVFRYTGP
jgi:hypothetical protein